MQVTEEQYVFQVELLSRTLELISEKFWIIQELALLRPSVHQEYHEVFEKSYQTLSQLLYKEEIALSSST